MMTALITGLRLRCNRSPPGMAVNKENKDIAAKETHKEYIELGTRDPDVIFKDKGILTLHQPTAATTDFLLSRSLQFHLKILCSKIIGGFYATIQIFLEHLKNEDPLFTHL